MRTFKTEGIIIKRRNYGEADRIVTVLTKYHGKLHLKASGVRKITSRRSAHLELLNHTLLTVHQATSFSIVTEAEALNDFSGIKNDLTKVGLSYHICELVDGLCPEGQDQQAGFMLLKKTLERLVTSSDPVLTIHEFEVELLTVLGYWHGQPEMTAKLDTQDFIENILEKRLKSKRMFHRFT